MSMHNIYYTLCISINNVYVMHRFRCLPKMVKGKCVGINVKK